MTLVLAVLAPYLISAGALMYSWKRKKPVDTRFNNIAPDEVCVKVVNALKPLYEKMQCKIEALEYTVHVEHPKWAPPPSPLPPPAPTRTHDIDKIEEHLGWLRIELGNVARRVTEQEKEHDAAPTIDTKSLLELIHAQQISMVTMVAGVVKDISQHAAATITAPLLSQLNRPQPPQRMMTPQPWYGRDDAAVLDAADPFEAYMPPSPYNHTGQPSAGYVAGDNDEPFGIEGLKWPQGFQQGMVRPNQEQ